MLIWEQLWHETLSGGPLQQRQKACVCGGVVAMLNKSVLEPVTLKEDILTCAHFKPPEIVFFLPPGAIGSGRIPSFLLSFSLLR